MFSKLEEVALCGFGILLAKSFVEDSFMVPID